MKKPLALVLGMAFFLSAVVFSSAGTLEWWNGWLFIAVCTLSTVTVSVSVLANNPELMEERRKAHREASRGEKLLVILMSTLVPVASFIVSGLDRRFGWADPISPVYSVIAAMLFVAGAGMSIWAMKSNPFFSSHVRIQKERGHVVMSGGPYGNLRHPGYFGSMISNLSVPVILGSYFGLAVMSLIIPLFLLRISTEERVLLASLPGYSDYAKKVRYRLIPYLF